MCRSEIRPVLKSTLTCRSSCLARPCRSRTRSRVRRASSTRWKHSVGFAGFSTKSRNGTSMWRASASDARSGTISTTGTGSSSPCRLSISSSSTLPSHSTSGLSSTTSGRVAAARRWLCASESPMCTAWPARASMPGRSPSASRPWFISSTTRALAVSASRVGPGARSGRLWGLSKRRAGRGCEARVRGRRSLRPRRSLSGSAGLGSGRWMRPTARRARRFSP